MYCIIEVFFANLEKRMRWYLTGTGKTADIPVAFYDNLYMIFFQKYCPSKKDDCIFCILYNLI